jgi:hypothetical protein
VTDIQKDRQTDRQTDRQKAKQTDRKGNSNFAYSKRPVARIAFR